jgi:hypothetical protein
MTNYYSNKRQSNNSTGGGIGFLGLLAILFIGLKLTGFINWSWWWVTAPLWGCLALAIIIVTIFFVVTAISVICKEKRVKRK